MSNAFSFGSSSSHATPFGSRGAFAASVGPAAPATPPFAGFRPPGDAAQPDKFVSHIDSLLSQPRPNNVRFFFPRTSSELWANSDVLSSASPYFKDLLSSGFAEASSMTGLEVSGELEGKRSGGILGGKDRKRAMLDNPGELDFEDSDDERDSQRLPTRVEPNSNIPAPWSEVVITDAAHSTFKAVLIWIYTSHINFIPLAADDARKAATQTFSFGAPGTAPTPIQQPQELPGRPFAVSPKSVYRLADFLQIGELKKLALEFIKQSLQQPGTNIVRELFSQHSQHYIELQEVVLDYAAKNWRHVGGADKLEDVKKRIEEGGEDAATLGLISHRLIMRLVHPFSSSYH
ncbi:hypothetical protein T439DRAFT_323119 [Meredithblackwellia eburnea MCA 4105]